MIESDTTGVTTNINRQQWREGDWPRKEVWGCAAMKTPYSCVSLSSKGSHFLNNTESLLISLLLWKCGICYPHHLNFNPNLSSQAPKLKIFSSQAPNLVIFSSQNPSFQWSVHKSHTSEIQTETPTWKKVECPNPNSQPLAAGICLKYFQNSRVPTQVLIP